MALSNWRVRTTEGLGGPIPSMLAVPVKGGSVCYEGGIAVIDAGFATPARTATGLVAAGVFAETVDNAAGADGAATVKVRPCVAGPFVNDAVAPVAAADLGLDCYLVDDETVAGTSGGGTRSRAGKVIEVTSEGVFVALAIGL